MRDNDSGTIVLEIKDVPHGIRDEFAAAVNRTGITDALRRAASVLPSLLRMSPAQFERYSTEFYQ